MLSKRTSYTRDSRPCVCRVFLTDYLTSFGCFKDTGNRAIPPLEGKDPILDGSNYQNRKHAIAKCAVASLRKDYHMFALQHDGWCASSTTAENTFDKHGRGGSCQGGGEGGPWANDVYVLGKNSNSIFINSKNVQDIQRR